MQIDVCNGDADGLCAVVQWRLQTPAAARLVTGLKRDIALLERVQAGVGDAVLVCDISMRRNQAALLRLLQAGAQVRYFDHHAVDAVPAHPQLQAHIDGSPGVCTSSLMDHYLQGRQRTWAVVGAFGDNLQALGGQLARSLGLGDADTARLRTLGEAINYNAYGDSEEDVLIAPQALLPILLRFANPLELLAQHPIAADLEARRQADLQQARAVAPCAQDAGHSLYVLPDAAWSRRVSGSLCNLLALEQAQRALAVLRPLSAGAGYVVSVRAPQSAPVGAAAFCQRFGGDGRAAAAGIDHLPATRLQQFAAAFAAWPWQGAAPRTVPLEGKG